MKFRQRRLRHLLTTASAAAIIVGLHGPAQAIAVCTLVNGAGNFNNSTTIDCIEVDTALTGNIVNTAPGTITNTIVTNPPGGAPRTSSSILVVGTLSGAIQNSGTIFATLTPGSFDIQAGTASKITNGITNSRLMTAEGTDLAVGIYIASPTFQGGITNTSPGLIQAIADRPDATGTAAAGGIITRGHATFFGGITNSGTINVEAFNGAVNDAIGIGDGTDTFFGGISNSGSISAQGSSAIGIGVAGLAPFMPLGPVLTFSGGISNSGSISVVSVTNYGAGIYVRADTFSGGISNSGTLDLNVHNGSGIFVKGSTFLGGISNSGVISISDINGAIGITAFSVSTFFGGITNSGKILVTGPSEASGILVGLVSTFSGNVVNSGTVSVTGSGGSGFDIGNISTFLGGVTNTGLINYAAAQTAYGIDVFRVSVFTGGITNSGTIQVTADGRHGDGIAVSAVSIFSGGISNGGLINVSANGSAFGIQLNSVSIFSGGIHNTGTLVANAGIHQAFGIYVSSVSTFAGGISNSGSIMASSAGASAFGIYVRSVSTFAGGISNAGLIRAASGGFDSAYGVYVTSVSTFLGGISNSGTILANALGGQAFGIYLVDVSTFSGGITNSGLIRVTDLEAGGKQAAVGIYVEDVSTFFGGISNHGTIIAQSVGSAIGIYTSFVSTFLGGITNSGLINVTSIGAGSAFGIYDPFISVFSGNVVNSGTILATSAGGGAVGIYVTEDSTFLGGVTNTGLIGVTAARTAAGIYVSQSSFGGGITNAGTILVSSVASGAPGILFAGSTFSGGITNSGLIKATSGALSNDFADGIDLRFAATAVGDVVNAGTILANAIAGFGTGIFTRSTTFVGNLRNSGMISATGGTGAAGIFMEGTTFLGGITNTGIMTVSAPIHGNAIGIYALGSTIAGGITNTGFINVTAADGKAFGVYAEYPTFSGGISNSSTGIISARGRTAFGIYTSVATFFGGITNNGLISGSGDTQIGKGFGIYLDPLTFSGNVVNTGTIVGEAGGAQHAAIDGSLVANSFTIQNTGGTILGGVALSETVSDTFNIDGGFVRGRITGAAATVSMTSGTLELPLGASVGEGPADGGTAVTSFTMTGGNLQLDVSPTPTDANQAPFPSSSAIQGINGHVAANHLVISGNNLIVGVQPGLYKPTTVYEDVFVGNTAGSGTFSVHFDHMFTTSGVLGAELLPDGAQVGDPQNVNAADDLRLTFIGFGKGFVFNGAGPTLGQTPNEQQAGTGIDAMLAALPTLPPSSGASTLVGTLFAESGKTLLAALDQLGGPMYAENFNLMSGSPIFTSDSVQNVLWARGSGGSKLASARLGRDGMQVASAGQVLTDAGEEQTAQLPMGGPSAGAVSVWGRAYGVYSNIDSQTTPNVVPGLKEHRYGGIVGADYSFNEHWLIGGVFNYSHDTADFKEGAGNTKADNYLLGVYGQYRQGPWYVNAIGSGGWTSYDSLRNIMFPAIPGTAHSSYNGQNWGAYAEGGWDLGVQSFKLTPFVGLGYLHQNIDQFTETGPAVIKSELLTLKGDNDSLQTSLGVRGSTTFQVGGGWLTPELRAVWQHEFMDEQQATTDAFAINPGATFQIRGPKLSRETGVFGGGLTYTINPSAKVFVDYDFRANSDFTSHQVSAGMKWTFGAAPPAPPRPAPPPVPAAQPAPPPPAQTQTFVVYFDFDKSDLTPEAHSIILQAATVYKQTGAVNIKVDGYTDLAGTAKYNIGLSKRRADAVRGELVKDGVPNNAVNEAWHGKENPAVPTPDGVREPRNRRATIMLP